MNKTEEFKRRWRAAADRVAKFDATDGESCRSLPAICDALFAGLMQPESEAAWDAFVMLTQLTWIVCGKESWKP